MGCSWTPKLMPSEGIWIQIETGHFLTALDLGIPIALLMRHSHKNTQQCHK
ncbi:hypothetical protein I79_017175 [Cricetulus griseus]|uniref:Uncharacterized protein n=1 Tax=Cricetulus griseus TaxID=10029 RepID=G3I1C2_CRIGR|nr:hypothetical protein I79_017175 [Cricetulus griseus]